MSAYTFTIVYNRRKKAVGYFTGATIPSLTTTGLPQLQAEDTIAYSYQYSDHGVLKNGVISNSTLTAVPEPGTTGGPFAANASTFDLSANNNTVTIVAPNGTWRLTGSFQATVGGNSVTVEWDPEAQVGTGAD